MSNPYRTVVAGICRQHGYFDGSQCSKCIESANRNTINIQTYEHYKGWYEHIDEKPMYIESREQLARECEKRGSYAKALMKPKSQGKGYCHRV